MGMNGRVMMPGPQAGPQMQLAAPFNDIQLVALMASQLRLGVADDPRELVDLAMDIVAEAVVQAHKNPIPARIKAKQSLQE